MAKKDWSESSDLSEEKIAELLKDEEDKDTSEERSAVK